MGKKQKFRNRKKVELTPKQSALRSAGIVITVDRKESLKRLLDSAVALWFADGEPLAVHLIAMAIHECLQIIGKETGKAPALGEMTNI